MSSESETPKKFSIFGTIRYLVIVVFSIGLIWWAMQPPGEKITVSRPGASLKDAVGDAPSDAILVCNGTTMGPIPYCVKVRGWESTTDSKEEQKTELQQTVQAELEKINRLMSTYRSDSEVSRFNASESTDWFEVSPETAQVVRLAQEVSELTDGAFDITVGPLVNRWGFGPDDPTGDRFEVPAQEELDRIKASVGFRHLEVRTDPPALKKDIGSLEIDLSAIAKGFAVDQVARKLESRQAENYLIEVGGETRAKGEKSPGKQWLIGIEIPKPDWLGEPDIQRLVYLGSKSMATSGDYRNFILEKGVRFSHIIDPRTGRPAEGTEIQTIQSKERLGSLSVIDSSCARADALATGLFVLGIEEGLKLADRQKIAVLFLVRSENREDSGKGKPKIQIREILSEAFRTQIDSWSPEKDVD